MANFDVSKAIFWVLLTGVSLILALVIALPLTSTNNIEAEPELTPEQQEKIIKAQYYRDIKMLLDDYVKEVGPIEDLEADDDYAEITVEVRSRALEMHAPEEAKAMHLDIVVSLNYLASGFEGDEESLEKGKEMLADLIEGNSLNVQ